ncbi:type II secretion system F family protein [Maliponia aquimaris]|uniref:Type II secretion system protein F n=1 Tax=Maliponia aquimaris TaxID=1673631 RepID=A0A238KD38_9RHOB|nr:type II secretion system F family protein [Maliponia aquimaris]SMX40771.1 Type II secretion system protein F [Maliponia aquimaris]
MRAFGYVAFTAEGRRRAGTVVAETESHASEQLKKQGLYVSELTERGQARGPRAPGLGRARLSRDLQAVFTRQMAVLLGAEMAVDAALGTLRSAGSTAALDLVVARAQAALLEGDSLATALEQSGAGFPRYYLAAVQAGERAGELSAVFETLAEHLETARSDRAQLGSALVYPAFVAVVSVLVAGLLFTTVAPEIVSLFETSGRPLPALTQVMLGAARWIQGHLPLLGAVALALVALGVASGRVAPLREARDGLLLRLPVVGGLIRAGAAVQYLRTLALVLESRHTVPIAVDSAASVLTIRRFRTEAEAVAVAIREGETLSTALSALSFVPPVARQLIGAGEVSARVARMTGRAAALVENGLSTQRKRLAALLEPALMMLVGGMVLVIVLSVLLPIFDLQTLVAP